MSTAAATLALQFVHGVMRQRGHGRHGGKAGSSNRLVLGVVICACLVGGYMYTSTSSGVSIQYFLIMQAVTCVVSLALIRDPAGNQHLRSESSTPYPQEQVSRRSIASIKLFQGVNFNERGVSCAARVVLACVHSLFMPMQHSVHAHADRASVAKGVPTEAKV